MSKLVESFLADAIERVKTPEIQEAVKTNILAPLLMSILKFLAPILVVLVLLWVLTLGGVIVLLMRDKVRVE